MEYKINCLAMAIVNNTNEINGASVETRQKNNDKCFDFAVEKIKEFLSRKGTINATVDKEENVNVDLRWKDNREMYFLTTSLFSTLIKKIGKENLLQLVEEGDRLRIVEEG